MRDNQYFREEEQEFFYRELNTFVPDRIFDVHAHVNHPNFYTLDIPGLPLIIGYNEYRKFIEYLHPARQVAAMFLAFSLDEKKVPLANEATAQAVAADSNCKGLFFVRPHDDPEWVRDEVNRLRLHGLKCYHTFSSTRPTWEAEIPSYLPEKFVKVADEENWVITLHIAKSRALADPSNIYWIRNYCKKYSNIKLILAHSSRGFQPSHNFEGLPQLIDLNNLFFDTSANCAPHAHETILRMMGHKKLLYGADSLVVSHRRGTTVPVSDTFVFLYENQPIWDTKHKRVKPVLIGLEHLRSLKWACWSAKITDSQIEDVFWNNAAELF